MALDTHGANGEPWTGFDLDGTLAVYDKWRGVANIGKPIKPMCDLIRKLHDEGKSVKILTARVAPRKDGSHHLARVFIARWCRANLGFVPPITHEKDALMETLYDDRVHAVEQNTGKVLNMAKFKVGDRVRDIRYGGRYEAKIVKVVPGRGMTMYTLDAPVSSNPSMRVAAEDEIEAANAARNAAGYVDADKVMIYRGDAVVFKSDYRAHKDDDEWLDRNGDTVREVRGDEVKIGPSANDWVKAKDLMVWHNSRAVSRYAVVQKALNAVAKNVSDGAKAMRRPLNAKFKVGDKVVVKGIGKTVIKTVDEIKSVVGPKNKYGVDIGGGKIMVVPEKDVSANACRNAVARNDKWIDDFHVIVTAGNPDPALLEALKKKAAAWKAAKRNFSDKAAADAHVKATDDAMAIAKRLGARWIQQGAVTRVVMPNAARLRNAVVANALNAVATNVKSYPFYVVDKAMKGKCIFSGRYELSDANDDVAELKKSGVESKAVPRRVLLMSGIDPDEESSWKKNHKKD